MSLCLIAFGVFAFLGIFSAKYRRWAKEAFSCVSRRLTLRPCNTDLNQKLKAKTVSFLMKKSPKTAKLTMKHFELISWVFTIVTIVSLLFTMNGLYNLAIYGTCDPAHPELCVFNTQNQRIECPDGCTPCVCDGEIVQCNDPIYDQCNHSCNCQEICEKKQVQSSSILTD